MGPDLPCRWRIGHESDLYGAAPAALLADIAANYCAFQETAGIDPAIPHGAVMDKHVIALAIDAQKAISLSGIVPNYGRFFVARLRHAMPPNVTVPA